MFIVWLGVWFIVLTAALAHAARVDGTALRCDVFVPRETRSLGGPRGPMVLCFGVDELIGVVLGRRGHVRCPVRGRLDERGCLRWTICDVARVDCP